MKKALQIILLLVIIGGIAGYMMYNKPHENIENAKSDLQISAEALFTDFESDEAAANEKYNDKLVEVTGKVVEVSSDDSGIVNVILDSGSMFGVVCKLDELTEHKRTEFSKGEEVTFKGKCTGINMDVLLVRCVEVE